MTQANLERLQEAEAALAEACARRDEISQRMRDLSTTADQRRAGMQQLQQPRQERRSMIARLLRLGRAATDDEGQRLRALADEAATAEGAIHNAADDLAAMADLEGELQAEANELHPAIAALQIELAEARARVAQDELEQQAAVEFVAALEAFRLALAKVYGAENAARRLRAKADAMKPENAGRVHSGLIYPEPLPALGSLALVLTPLGALMPAALRNPDQPVHLVDYNRFTLTVMADAQRVSADTVARLSRPR